MTKKTLGDFGFVGGITNPIEPEHAVGHLTDKQLEMVNAAADTMSKAKMTNNQNWPHRVLLTQKLKDEILGALGYAQLIAADSLEITEIFNKPKKEIIKIKQERVNELQRISDELQRCEIISSEKVREIQLATIAKAFAVALYELARSGKFGQVSTGEILDSIDPQSIIEQVGKA